MSEAGGNDAALAGEIRRGADGLGVEVDAEAVRRLVAYLELLGKWSRRINLVAGGTEREWAERHVVDSLAVLPHLARGVVRLIDVGSGAGLPGAVLAMARPDLSVTSLEPIHKKHAFQSAVKRELGLGNFVPLAERVEQHCAGAAEAPQYDVAVSRATFAVEEWLRRGAELVCSGGRVVAMEGKPLEALPAGVSRHPYNLGGRARAILVRAL